MGAGQKVAGSGCEKEGQSLKEKQKESKHKEIFYIKLKERFPSTDHKETENSPRSAFPRVV